MNRELGIARCGLACCLCSKGESCGGCKSNGCAGANGCYNRKCSTEKGWNGCYDCGSMCREGILGKIKPYAFSLFARRYGTEALMDCLQNNEKNGIVYHRQGIIGDYDGFEDAETLIEFIRTGIRKSEKQSSEVGIDKR